MKITRFLDIPRFTDAGRFKADFQLDHLVKNIEEWEQEYGLQLCPDFQRGHVWTREQQIAFVEFFLRGGRSGRDLYFNCPSWVSPVPDGAYDEFVCVDGLQRLTAIRRFITNEIPCFGSYYKEFEDSIRILIDTMRVHINNLKSKKEVLQWYIEMNSGGTVHTDYEISRVRRMMEECQ